MAKELSAQLNAEESAPGELVQRFDKIFAQHQPWADSGRAHYSQMIRRHARERVAEISDEEAAKRRVRAVGVMMQTRAEIDDLLRDGDNLVLDPFVRGLMLEQILWRREETDIPVAGQLYAVIHGLQERGGLLEQKGEMQFSLMSFLADLGFAPNEFSYKVLAGCTDGWYEDHIAATVLVRWGWPTQPHHAKAVREHLDAVPFKGERMTAVETLILLGHLPDVPQDALDEWFVSAVETSDLRGRRRALTYLLRSAEGRQYLLAKWEQMPEDSPLKLLVGSMFSNLIEATAEFEQYDYLSKQECDALQATLQLF